MAQVDFSNARIEPFSSYGSFINCINPTNADNVGLNGANFYNDSNILIVGNSSVTRLVNQQKQLMYLYQGTFTASGTEFYMPYSNGSRYSGWKVSNISFQSGDTYVFQINASLVCN